MPRWNPDQTWFLLTYDLKSVGNYRRLARTMGIMKAGFATYRTN